KEPSRSARQATCAAGGTEMNSALFTPFASLLRRPCCITITALCPCLRPHPSHSVEKRSTHSLFKVYLTKRKKYLSKKIRSNKLSTLQQVSGTMSANNPEDEHQPIFHGGYILWTDFNAASRLRVASSLLTSCCVMPGL